MAPELRNISTLLVFIQNCTNILHAYTIKYIHANNPPPSRIHTVSNTPAPERLAFRLSEFKRYIYIKSSPPHAHNTLSDTHTPERLTFRSSEFRTRT